ncbi:MAG: PleD family two-component response regulator [Bermanella sp.]|jgi:PleD family two-component response regulator
MFMIGATEMMAKAWAEELKRAISGLQYRFGSTATNVTLSLVIASRGPGDDSFSP